MACSFLRPSRSTGQYPHARGSIAGQLCGLTWPADRRQICPSEKIAPRADEARLRLSLGCDEALLREGRRRRRGARAPTASNADRSAGLAADARCRRDSRRKSTANHSPDRMTARAQAHTRSSAAIVVARCPPAEYRPTRPRRERLLETYLGGRDVGPEPVLFDGRLGRHRAGQLADRQPAMRRCRAASLHPDALRGS